ncbi:MAG: RrF2 family transcriptional regulator [Tepidanaerobacteraceae bacterium]|nr:RrF2 family transcriptional regulator [Thermoanaerobacterales bacterium]
MRLSTKGRYGLKAMFDLSLNYGGTPVPLRDIAERQGLSENYLEQIIANLRKAGLVQSVRGAHGGYNLTRKPSEITVGDVLRAVEGPLGIVDCVLEYGQKECSKYKDCITRIVWEKINDSIVKTTDSITLEDMCNEKSKN